MAAEPLPPSRAASPPALAPAGADRRMVRAELLGQHSHQTLGGVLVHIYGRGGKYIARGRYDGAAFGETLGGDPLVASSRLRRLLTEVEEGTFLRPTEARHRPLRRAAVPRLDLRGLCDQYLADVRRRRGRKTAATYLARLAPALSFAESGASRRRWPLAMDLDRDFAVALRAALFEAPVTPNGRAGATARSMSPRQVHNVLGTARALLAWATRPDVRRLPADFANPLTSDLVGTRPAQDPLRVVKLPLDLRIHLVGAMDAWQLCHLAPSLVLPIRPDEATGLLIGDVDLGRGRLRFGTRLGGRDFNKGRQAFEVPFPAQLATLFRWCIGGRLSGPLLRNRAAYEGRGRPGLLGSGAEGLEAAFDSALAHARGAVQSEQDAKTVFRDVLRRAGGASPDGMSREFKGLLRSQGLGAGIRFYDARAAVTTEMNRAGVPDLELRYLTGHATGDILNRYVTLDPDGSMAGYFRSIHPLLTAIADRAKLELGED
jgi:integrase